MTQRYQLALLASFILIFIWSAVRPADFFTWVLEVFPAVIGLVILLATYRRFPLTNLLYTLIWIHAIILVVGGHYMYANVPIGNWLRDAFDLSRNHYDRLGHFAQGFVPAIIAREILLRHRVVNGSAWLFFIIVCIALAISSTYELLEWAVAEISGSGAVEFLAFQGDVWDTQKDMALAGIGAVTALWTLSRWHDRQLARLKEAR